MECLWEYLRTCFLRHFPPALQVPQKAHSAQILLYTLPWIVSISIPTALYSVLATELRVHHHPHCQLSAWIFCSDLYKSWGAFELLPQVVICSFVLVKGPPCTFVLLLTPNKIFPSFISRKNPRNKTGFTSL